MLCYVIIIGVVIAGIKGQEQELASPSANSSHAESGVNRNALKWGCGMLI